MAARSTSRLERSSSPGRSGALTDCVHPGLGGHGAVELVDRRLVAGPDVADQAAAPGGGPHEGVDHVVDEDEVPGLLAVPEDGHRLAAQQALGEDGHHAGLAVGVLPGPVHVGQGQGGELQGVQLAVGHQVVDAPPSWTPRRATAAGGVGLAHREVLGGRLAVEGAPAGGEDHPFGLGLPGPLETLSEPTTLTSASNAGSATETRTSAWAARWKTSSGRRRAISSTTAGA
jgi:hypothetical protein